MPTRRLFLKNSAVAAFGLGAAPAWLARAAAATDSRNILVVVFQRGAMDGLSAVVPFGDNHYAPLRPTLAQPAKSLLDLDGFFGLHPALSPLKPLYDQKALAIVHASGSPDPTRSHFDAQDYMESGTPGRKSTRDGWLNRALPQTAQKSPIRAVSMGASLARTLRGPNPAVAVQNLGAFRVKDNARDDFMAMYAKSPDPVLQSTGRDTFEAVKLIESINQGSYQPANGARYPNSRLGQGLQQIARLIKAEQGLQVAFADSTGWDTHINQAPQLQNLLNDFAQSLAAFHADLGSRMANIAVVTMSEFGRTARENGNRGTDHGRANVMFSLGGPVRGGKVYGQFPGLAPEQLYEGRDLAITTDFRAVLWEALHKHLGASNLPQVFPGFDSPKLPGLLG